MSSGLPRAVICASLAGTLGVGSLTACGEEPAPTEVRVAAAASLQPSFTELGQAFVRSHPEYTVAPMAFDGSQVLATQVTEGAPVDVLATADEPSMAEVVETGQVDDPATFATNTLQLAVPAGATGEVDSWDDLTTHDVAVCAPEVPCGRATERLLRDLGIAVRPVSQETSVSGVVTRVAEGEVDAGIVYVTDVAASGGRLRGVDAPLPTGVQVPSNAYRIGVTDRAGEDGRTAAARAFTDFVLSPEGQAILQEHSFGAP